MQNEKTNAGLEGFGVTVHALPDNVKSAFGSTP